MNFHKVTDSAVDPVSLADAKAHMRVSITDDDALITAMITSARIACEQFCRRAFVTQTWMVAWDGIELLPYIMPYASVKSGWTGQFPFPTLRSGMPTVLTLPIAPLQSVNSITSYTMSTNAATVFAASNYYVDTNSEPGRVALINGAVWPTDLREIHALEVSYQVGYGDAASNVPNDIVSAIKAMVAYLYENRGDEDDTTASRQSSNLLVAEYVKIPKVVQTMLGHRKIWKIG